MKKFLRNDILCAMHKREIWSTSIQNKEYFLIEIPPLRKTKDKNKAWCIKEGFNNTKVLRYSSEQMVVVNAIEWAVRLFYPTKLQILLEDFDSLLI